jgi:hypothetical protein
MPRAFAARGMGRVASATALAPNADAAAIRGPRPGAQHLLCPPK